MAIVRAPAGPARTGAALALATALTLVAAGCGAHPATSRVGASSTPGAAATATSPGHRLATRPQPGGGRSEHTGSIPATGAGQPAPGSYDDTTGGKARPPQNQQQVLAHLPGSSRSRCIPVGDQHAVRSGALAMGDFATARAAYRATRGAYDGPPSNFYVIPRDIKADRVVVTLTRVGGTVPPIRVSADHLEGAAQWKFFPISVKITKPGTWRISVSTGNANGCFEARFAV